MIHILEKLVSTKGTSLLIKLMVGIEAEIGKLITICFVNTSFGMSKHGNVRSVIELFCKIFQENNVSIIRAETLRQGKFNNDSAVSRASLVCFIRPPKLFALLLTALPNSKLHKRFWYLKNIKIKSHPVNSNNV